jgi:hypothetical protein
MDEAAKQFPRVNGYLRLPRYTPRLTSTPSSAMSRACDNEEAA